MHCRPRQTPKIGIFPASSRITSSEIPAWSGSPGPGEMMIASGLSARMASSPSMSLR